jgi:hypothetical protein
MEISSTALIILCYWVLLGIALVLFVGATFSGRVLLSFAIGLFLVNFLLRFLVIGVNETTQFFPPKVQWDYSIRKFYEYYGSGNLKGLLLEPFGAQVLWNLPVWAFSSPSRYCLLMSNATAGSLAGPLAGLMIHTVTNRKTAVLTAILFSIYLGMFNFSIFCLRDPLLVLANTTIACMIVRIGFGSKHWRELIFGAIGVYFSLWLRPEQFFIILFILGLPVSAYYVGLFRRRSDRRRSVATALLLLIPISASGVASILGATYVASSNIGQSTIDPLEVAGERAEERFSRHTDSDFGAGSHVIDVQTYANLPVYVRVPIQVVGLVVLPFPWQVDGPDKLLAFVDSLTLILMIWVAVKYFFSRRLPASHQWIVMALLAAFLIGILGMGVVVSNAGNGFRMRVSIVPFLILAAALAWTHRSILSNRLAYTSVQS